MATASTGRNVRSSQKKAIQPQKAPKNAVRKKRTAGNNKPKQRMNFDMTILIVVMTLVMLGLVMVFSSSYYYAMTNSKIDDKLFFFTRQLMWAGVGTVAMVICMNINFNLYKKFAFLSYIVFNILLLGILVLGVATKGSKRWVGIGEMTFQPSEFAKIAVIIYLSYYVVTQKDALSDLKGFLKCCGILGIPVILIGAQNLSTAIVVAAIGAAILFVASPRVIYFVVAGIIGAVGIGAALALPIFRYRIDRITAWLDPWSVPLDGGYQIIQSLFAVASGGFFGLGLGQSRQKTFIPEAYNDIIFAIICEELGMIGALLVLTLFVILIWRGIRVAMHAVDMYSSLVATGITTMIAVQVIINIAVVTNSMPNTGMPMPFISYGGTSLLVTMASMGILMNISRYQKER